ncbi:uncharacterized protein [Branchiostoma lanceolatum]|uniref:uncharacterized protein n=1 Tax=Branchiostoma lanceolatum TaxID=7740 RepID=UPI00345314A6
MKFALGIVGALVVANFNLVNTCPNPVDLVFLLDSGESFRTSGYEDAKTFIQNVVNYFTLGEDDTRVGVVTYSNYGWQVTHIKLNEKYDRVELLTAIRDIPYDRHHTFTGLGLDHVRNNSFLEVNGRRSNTLDFLVVITDDEPEDSVTRPAQLLRQMGITVFVVGVGEEADISQATLDNIAGTPSRVFRLTDHDFLVDDRSIRESICNAAQCPALAAPANGARTPATGATSYRNVVTFTCNPGYQLNGTARVTCQADVSWSNPVPTCTRVSQTTAPPPGTCEPIPQDLQARICRSVVGYDTVSFPNSFGHMSVQQILSSEEYSFFNSIYLSRCYPDILTAGCRMFLPECENATQIQLCRDVCEQLNASCASVGLGLPFSCDIFPDRDDDPTCFLNEQPTSVSRTTAPPTDPCNSYIVLNEASRSILHVNIGNLDNCDIGFNEEWYRFMEPAGIAMFTAVPPSLFRCGADFPTWINGTHPAVSDGVVSRQACVFFSGDDICPFETTIHVKACSAGHYVYQLPRPPVCNMTYCGHTPVNCPKLAALVNGNLSPTDANTYPDVVTFSCDQGYELDGSTSATCRLDGTWSASVPTCIDLDECEENTAACPQESTCLNTPGGYLCTYCSPEVTILGGGSPIPRSRAFTLTSRLSVSANCNEQRDVKYKWEVLPPSGTQWQVPADVVSTKADLLVPPQRLDYGVYTIRVWVTLTLTNTGFEVSGTSDNVTVTITASPLVAGILGGSRRQVGAGEVTLDAATLSSDPDGVIARSADLDYRWSCDSITEGVCPALNGEDDGLLRVNIDQVSPPPTELTFTVEL